MCGRYTLHADSGEVAAEFEVERLPLLVPRFNVAPGQDVACVGIDQEGQRALRLYRWGLIPYWSKEPKSVAIQARMETAATRPAFREALRRHRCLLPADGFYEWQDTDHGRVPHHVRRRDGGLFALAAIWERWKGEGGDELRTCAVLTRPAEGPIAAIHDRMPLIVARRDYTAWLDREERDGAKILAALTRVPGESFEVFEVSRRVNDVRHDGPELVLPAR